MLKILKNSDVPPAESEQVIDYFKDTWIGHPQNRSRRRATKFSLEWWNCYEKVRARAPKTNNAHRRRVASRSRKHTWSNTRQHFQIIGSSQERRNVDGNIIIWTGYCRRSSLQEKEVQVSSRSPIQPRQCVYDDDDMDDEELCLEYLRGIAHNLRF